MSDSSIIIRAADGDGPVATPAWDTLWSTDLDAGVGGTGDWALASQEETANRGGLAATEPLATAILLCLFTDARRPDGVEAPDGSSDRRGWAGDTFDLDTGAGERAIGSLLWTLERGPLDYQTRRLAEHYAAEALQTLIDQGLVERFDIAAAADKDRSALVIEIAAWGPAGERLYAQSLPIF